MHRLIWLCLLTLVVTACGRPVEIDPDEMSHLIAEGVQSTLTAESVNQAIELGVQATLAALQPTSTAVRTLDALIEQTPTRAPTPTATQLTSPTAVLIPSPSATPIPGPEVITDRVVNLRAGPGTGYPVVASTTPNDVYPVTGTNSDGSWFEVCCHREMPVWVAASVVTTKGNWDSVAVVRNIPTVSPTLLSPPAPSPVSQILVSPPPDWVEYRQSGGLFAFHHPPSWQEGVPMANGAQFAILQPYQYFSVTVYLEERWRGKTDGQIQSSMLESAQTVASSGGSTFVLISQGRLPTVTRTNAIQYTLERNSIKTRWIRMVVIVPDESVAIGVTGSSTKGDLAPMTDMEAQIIAGSFLRP